MGPGRSLDTVSSETGTQPQQLLALAKAAADHGDLEVAYLLYAKGSSESASRDASEHQKFVSGQLQTLSAMCQPPTAAAIDVAATAAPSSTNCAGSSGPKSQPHQTVSGISTSSTTTSVTVVPKRWQQMQQRLYANWVNSSTDVQTSTTAGQHHALHMQHPSGSNTTTSSNGDSSTTTIISTRSSPVTSHMHPSSSSKTMSRRVFCVSDLHVDRAGGANMAWLKAISSSSFRNDVLIVAGDIADTAAAVNTAFQLLSKRFWRVVWVPGNHELWLRRDTRDRVTYPGSWAKLMALRQMADAAGVDVGPVEVQPGLLVVPLLSWYNTAFDVEDPRPGRYQHDSFCSWGPVPEHDVWQVMMKLNNMILQLVEQYKQQWQQQQQPLLLPAQLSLPPPQQQQQNQASHQQYGQQRNAAAGSEAGVGVCWAKSGFLAVATSTGRRVPGLQLKLTKQSRHTAAAGGASSATTAAGPCFLQHADSRSGGGDSGGGSSSSDNSGSRSGGAVNSRGSLLSLPSTSSDSWSLLDAPATNSSTSLSSSSSSSNSSSSRRSLLGSSTEEPQVTPDVTVITVSHFLPHPQLPHSCYQELRKAMGCQELQLQMQQVSSAVHVYGHSHRCADVTLDYTLTTTAAAADVNGTHGRQPAPAAAAMDQDTCSGTCTAAEQQQQQQQQHSCRYVQYALDAVGAESAGLYCLWDGEQLCPPGVVLPTS